MSNRNLHTTTLWMGMTIVMLLAIYVLSIGPTVWLLASGKVPSWIGTALMFPYFPLILIAFVSDSARDLLNWYIQLWAPNASVGI